MQTKAPETMKMMIELEVPVKDYEELIDFMLKDERLVSSSWIGHWAQGVECTMGDDPAWLLIEHHEDEIDQAVIDDLIKLVQAGEELPDGAYILDKEKAAQVVGEGLTMFGLDFANNWDQAMLDHAIQMTLIGEIAYE